MSIGSAFVNFGVLKCGDIDSVQREIPKVLEDMKYSERLQINVEKFDSHYEIEYWYQQSRWI